MKKLLLMLMITLQLAAWGQAINHTTVTAHDGAQNHFVYGAATPTVTGWVTEYGNMVKSLPICCVDIFVYDATDKSYLMVKRTAPPAEGAWWVPGGRLFKGETFFACAERKCRDEIGVQVIAKAVLGVYSTIFDVSAWDCVTHTINVAVLTQVVGQHDTARPDDTIASYRWDPIEQQPEDPYLQNIYRKAIGTIVSNNAQRSAT